MNPIAEDILMHYGVKRRSGRYPWGSGENPYQHSGDFVSRAQRLKKDGLSETDIAKEMGFDSTTDYRLAYSIAKNERRRQDVARAKSLSEDGLGATEIGRIMGINESTVRSYLNPNAEHNMNVAQKTSDIFKKEIGEKRYMDIGAGVERELGITRKNFDEAVRMLEYQGYNVVGIGVPQPNNPSKRTTMKVLCEPGDPKAQQRELYSDPSLIKSFGDYHSVDGGVRWDKREYPASVDSKRIQVRYGDKGGSEKDGVIELRRGVADLDLGQSHYAQVRIMVDGTHYLKGMAMYSDDMPDGVDIIFNTNKKSGTPMIKGDEGVLKPIKSDPDNPFGAVIKAGGQSWYTDPKTGEKKLSAINKLKEEGDWDKSSRNLSSQFLSKQPLPFIQKQLKLTYADYEAEFDEIRSLTNPEIKKKYLMDFADACDSAVVHMKAAALPRQETRVILPITKLKETEVYAPYLNDGEHVVLVRYPHGGTFEIPELVVNNRNPSAKKILGNVTDAIGINAKVAERLSGADFDGDTVIVIPVNNKVRVKSTPPLKDLKDFDPKTEYPYREGMKILHKGTETQREMGMVSNLITDMTLRGAPESDIAKAVKHSMVVIDAAKHKLDYKQSEIDNDILTLKKRYQIKRDADGNPIGYGGASTLISKHKQTVRVPERTGTPKIDKETGEYIYKESGRTYLNKKGERVKAESKVYLLNHISDANSISSGTPQEKAYSDYINKMKALANKARKEYISTKPMERSKTAKETYASEVTSLMGKLDIAARNAPKERRAQVIANSVIKAKIQANPDLADPNNKKELNKVKRLAIDDARLSVGASSEKTRITITDNEWKAIQAGAISASKLQDILRYADADDLRQRAMPKATTTLSTAKVNKLKAMQATGFYTIAEIAEALGVSTSTVSKYLNTPS